MRLLVLLALMLAVACAPAPMGDDDLRPDSGTLFRHRWWNHYSRALEAADAGDPAAARDDLLAAIGRRSRDQRMARTYGMHFIDYFPHRELGVLHWLAGELKDARRELERSIEDYPSAKARYYLDRVREALIRQQGGPVAPPDLTLDIPAPGFRTREQPVRIRGRARDTGFVARLTVNQEAVFQAGSRIEVPFDHPLYLPQGRHEVFIAATNLSGRTTRRRVVVHVDRQGPWIAMTPRRLDDGRWRIEGTLHDPSGVAAFQVADREVDIVPGIRTDFRHDIEGARDPLLLEARDRLGNVTRVRLPAGTLTAAFCKPLVVAGLQSGALLAGWRPAGENGPPVIRLEGWQDRQTVYMDQVALAGSVRDRQRVTDVRVNGESVLPVPGPLVIFNHVVALNEGVNQIIIEARDAGGQVTRRELTIERKVPQALLLSERLRLGVFPFEQAGDVSPASYAFQDSFIYQLHQRHRFQIVERYLLEQILREQKLSRSRLIDPATALGLGRMAAAHAIVAGSLVETRMGIEIVGRVVDTETSEVLAAADVYGEVKSLVGYQDLARALALKIHREFPLVSGKVLQKHGEMILTDLGSEQIRSQRRLIVYQDREVDFPGEDPAVDHQVLGRARVVQLDPRMSKARLLEGCDPQIAPRNKVIAQ